MTFTELADRRAAPGVRVHTRRGGTDILWCGHGVDTEEMKDRPDAHVQKPRLLQGTEYRRCEKCALGLPVEFIIPTPGF